MSCRFGLQNSRREITNWKAANVTLFLNIVVFVGHHQKNPMNGLKTTEPDFHAHHALIFPLFPQQESPEATAFAERSINKPLYINFTP